MGRKRLFSKEIAGRWLGVHVSGERQQHRRDDRCYKNALIPGGGIGLGSEIVTQVHVHSPGSQQQHIHLINTKRKKLHANKSNRDHQLQ